MKSMSCHQLGGACEEVFTAETFDELAQQSQLHGREMATAQEPAHLAAMQKMMEIMKSGDMDAWMAARRSEFDSL